MDARDELHLQNVSFAKSKKNFWTFLEQSYWISFVKFWMHKNYHEMTNIFERCYIALIQQFFPKWLNEAQYKQCFPDI